MKASINNLNEPARIVKQAIGNEKTMPILSHILMNASEDNTITMTCTDLQTQLSISLDAEVERQGIACIPADKLIRLASHATDFPVRIDCTEQIAKLSAQHSRTTLNTLKAEDYPNLDYCPAENPAEYTIDAEPFALLINQIEHCAGKTDVRYYLNSILLSNQPDKLTLTASDGHRLGYGEIAISPSEQPTMNCIIPIRTAGLIGKLFKQDEITINISEQSIRVSNSRITLTARCIEADYPNITEMLDKPRDNHAEVTNEQLIQIIETAEITARRQDGAINLKLDANHLLTGSSNEAGEESSDQVQCNSSSGSFDLNFNGKYITTAANTMDGFCYINAGEDKSITLQPRNRAVTFLIMALKI